MPLHWQAQGPQDLVEAVQWQVPESLVCCKGQHPKNWASGHQLDTQGGRPGARVEQPDAHR
eukprot:10079240-Lingulodinium_polyedra.AAC.1